MTKKKSACIAELYIYIFFYIYKKKKKLHNLEANLEINFFAKILYDS